MHQTLCNHVCNSLTISGIRCTRNDNIKGLGRVAQPAKSLFKYELQELCRRLIECEAVAHSISVTFSNATPLRKAELKPNSASRFISVQLLPLHCDFQLMWHDITQAIFSFVNGLKKDCLPKVCCSLSTSSALLTP